MNVQNIPRQNKVIKKIFIPKLDAFLFFDYSQIEYRLFAYYLHEAVGDDTAVQVFREGKDVHEEQARRIHDALGWDYDIPLTDAQRQIGKTSNFAAIYSGGIPTIQRQLGCDKQTARRIADAFHEDNPRLGRWKWQGRGFVDPDPGTLNDILIHTQEERGHIKTLWGRHLHPESPRLALNALIQGGAADLMRAAMVNIHDFMGDKYESHVVNTVHDELIFDCVDSEIPELVKAIPPLMGDDRIAEVLPVEVDVQISHSNWADKEDYAL